MFRKRLTGLFLLLFATLLANAQDQQLSGKILNEKNEPLAGVSIKILDGGGTTTDIEGRYTLTLSPGTRYTLLVSAIGYEPKQITDVEVTAGILNELNITLVQAAKDLGAVVVRSTTRRQESTTALLNFQRNNAALSSGLAADFIRRTPDKNTGEILKRVSGASIQDNKFVVIRGLSDRYNAAMINNALFPSTEPDKKAFSFDVLPSVLIDNIIINKTATPEFTGEFAGGLVQIQTKDIPSKNFINVGISLGFNTQSVFKEFNHNERNRFDFLGFDDGSRNLPASFPSSAQAYRALGATAEGREKQFALSRSFNNQAYAQQTSTALPTQTYSVTWGQTNKFRNGGNLGTVLSVNYRNSMLKYNVERRLHEDDGDLLVQLHDDQNKYAVNVGALANVAYVKGRHKISFKNLFNQLFEDNFYTRNGYSADRLQDIDFRSSVLNQRSLYSGQIEGEHQLAGNGIKLRWNGNASYNWKKQPDLRTQAYFRSINTAHPFELNDDDTRRFYSDLKDYSYGANGDLLFPFEMGGNKQTFKVGGSTLIRIRDFKSRILRYDPANPGAFDNSKTALPYDQVFDPSNIGADGFIITDFTNNQDKYNGVSIVNGMFGMFDNKLSNKLRLVWGARVENFQQVLTTKDVSAKNVLIHTDKWDVLPSFNLTLSPNFKQNIRLSASRTVSRPEFREIAPFAFYDYESNYAVSGNTDLKRGAIMNGDLRYEIYPKSGESISIGAFYKKFTDPIEFRLNPSSVLDRRNYEYQNADKATTLGAELEIRKEMDWLGERFENFNVFANLTYIYSKVSLQSTSGTGATETTNRPLQGQSPYLVNVGLQYNEAKGNWNGSLLYNRVGQRLALVGINELGFPDVYERPRNQLDLQLARKIINKRGELKLTVSDILNAPYYFYENVDSKKAFNKNVDRLFSKYTQGSTISLGFNYDFNL